MTENASVGTFIRSFNAEIYVSAYVINNSVPGGRLSSLINQCTRP